MSQNKGPTLADVCRIAATRGVGIRIFVQDNHVGMTPARITIQVTSRQPGVEPRAFMMDMREGNDQLGEALGVTLMEYINKVSSGLILPLNSIVGRA